MLLPPRLDLALNLNDLRLKCAKMKGKKFAFPPLIFTLLRGVFSIRNLLHNLIQQPIQDHLDY